MPGPRPAELRLRRLLVMLPWLMERGRVPVEEMARTFHLRPDQLIKDLELASVCGLPPYVDEMIDVFVDDGWVEAGVPRLFNRPLRLTPREGFALLAAGRAALELPGADPDGPLARALTKLERVLGERATVTVSLDEPPLLDVVRRATEEGEALAITYWSATRDARTDREIEPHRLFLDQGRWYLTAHDGRSGEQRTFRVDRIEAARPTGRRFTPVAEAAAPPDPGAALAADARRVTVLLPAEAAWVPETYPVDEVRTRPDGRLEVRLPVAGVRFLEVLLLRAGPEAEVLEPADLRDVGRAAARRLLGRYR